MGSATITDTYRRDARLYSGLDVLTSAPRSSEATFPFTSCCIASSISGSGVEAVLGAGCGADLVVVAGAPLAVLELGIAGAAVAVLAGADFDAVGAGAALRARVVAVLASSGPAPAPAFFAEEEAAAPAVLVDAARVVFFTAGLAVSAGPVAARTTAPDFFLGVLAGAAPAVLFVLIFFFGTLAAAVLLAALDGFAAVDARRSGVCGLQVGVVVMHRAHRPRRYGFRTREDIVWSGCRFGLGLHFYCNLNRRAPLLSSCRDQSEKSRLEGYGSLFTCSSNKAQCPWRVALPHLA